MLSHKPDTGSTPRDAVQAGSPDRRLQWYLAAIAIAIAGSWLASLVHATGWAPLGLISLVVGGCLGAALAACAWWIGAVRRRQLVLGVVSSAVLAALAQHAWLYLHFRRQWHAARQKSPEVAMFRDQTPWSPAQYLAHELTAQSAALWTLDAVLIVSAAVAAALVLHHAMHQKHHTLPV